jgi:pyridinium-3,5-biscarboxylic acid mononucleotide sulfurtransferase
VTAVACRPAGDDFIFSSGGTTLINFDDSESNLLADKLVARLTQLVPCVVAYSGGVDSAVVASAAARAEQRLLAEASTKSAPWSNETTQRSIAVTAVSAAVPEMQREIASRVAGEIGIEHRFVATEELSREDYARNDQRRCFFCKQTLYQSLGRIAAERGGLVIVSGTNADDLGDYRPGIDAGRAASVVTPLADLGIGKSGVRAIAAAWDLSVAQLPAAPCLASRIAYGVSVSGERLRMIELAERWLGEQGFSPLRVRLHEGELARIEVAPESLPRLVAPPLIDEVRRRLSAIGFRAVTVDLAGFRSGSMNQLFNLTLPESKQR